MGVDAVPLHLGPILQTFDPMLGLKLIHVSKRALDSMTLRPIDLFTEM